MWAQIERDPKLETFQRLLDTDPVLAENHLIIFTESKETAEYLNEQLSKKFPTKVLLFAGSSGEADRKKVLENFDNKSNKKSNEFRILITTDVLAE
jgi:superfamily II DNA/RNA helicase